jgi:hypothetical protein
MKISKLGLLILLLTLLGMLPGAMAQTAENVGLPYPTAIAPKAIDLGELKEQLVGESLVRIVNLSKNKFFGFEPVDVLGYKVMISDREKTAIDCIDRPALAGGGSSC